MSLPTGNQSSIITSITSSMLSANAIMITDEQQILRHVEYGRFGEANSLVRRLVVKARDAGKLDEATADSFNSSLLSVYEPVSHDNVGTDPNE